MSAQHDIPTTPRRPRTPRGGYIAKGGPTGTEMPPPPDAKHSTPSGLDTDTANVSTEAANSETDAGAE